MDPCCMRCWRDACLGVVQARGLLPAVPPKGRSEPSKYLRDSAKNRARYSASVDLALQVCRYVTLADCVAA